VCGYGCESVVEMQEIADQLQAEEEELAEKSSADDVNATYPNVAEGELRVPR